MNGFINILKIQNIKLPLMILVLILLFVVLPGCTSFSVIKGCAEGDQCIAYAQVSEGKVSGLAASVTGAADTCKGTIYGDPKGWKIEFSGEKCTASFNGGDIDLEIDSDEGLENDNDSSP